jgi:iron complex transport system substrate-binding protein
MASVFLKFTATLLAALLTCTFPACAYERIISLYPGHTDNIIALNGQSKLVGISQNDDPETLPGLLRFPMKTGAEALLALKPDLVLMRTLVTKQNPELKDVLERAGVKVILIDPPSWEGFAEYLRELAPLIDVNPDDAAALFIRICSEIREKAEGLRKGRTVSVFVESTARDLHTCAPDSWAARLIELAGGTNAAASAVPARRGSAVAPWGLERVMKLLSAGLDVYLVQNGAMNRTTPEELKARSWASALGTAKVAFIPEAHLARPSLKGLREGGMKLIQIFYGE